MKSFSDRCPRLTDRARPASLFLALCVAVSLLASGCASMANTPEQELAWSRWRACQFQASGTELNSVRVDGRISFWYDTGGDRQGALDCLQQLAKDGAHLPEPLAEPLPSGSGGAGAGM